MEKRYRTREKESIEQVIKVFSDYIQTANYFDLLWSDKVGYIYMSIDTTRGTVGDIDCTVIDHAEKLLDKFLYGLALDILAEGGYDPCPADASPPEREEIIRRLKQYMDQLPEYQDRINLIFEYSKTRNNSI